MTKTRSLRIYMSEVEDVDRLIPETERDYPDQLETPIQELHKHRTEFLNLTKRLERITESQRQISAMQEQISKIMAALADKIADLPSQ